MCKIGDIITVSNFIGDGNNQVGNHYFVVVNDKNGEIDLRMMIDEYANMIPENGYIFDLREFVNNDLVRNMLPSKALVIKREDIMSLLT